MLYRVMLFFLAIAVAIPRIDATASAMMPDAIPIFSDSFTDTSKINLIKTTGFVSTIDDGHVELRKAPLANAIAAQSYDENGTPTDIQIVDKSGVHWYTLDQATDSMAKLAPLSPTGYSSAIGVSMVTDSSSTGYVLEKDGTISQFVMDTYGPAKNPFMTTQLKNVVSITAMGESEFAASTEDGVIYVFRYNETSQIAEVAYTVPTFFKDIKSIQTVPGTPDFLFFTTSGAYNLIYDQATDDYLIQPVFIGQNGVISGTSNKGDFITLLTPDKAITSVLDQDGNMIETGTFAISYSSAPIAVSRPSDTNVVIAFADGTVRTFRFDVSSNSMVEDVARRISNLQFLTEYQSPGIYQSIPISAGEYNMFRIVPVEQNDPGSSISYEISTDAGINFTNISPNAWVHLRNGSGVNAASGPYVVRATLKGSPSATPRLLKLDVAALLDNTPPTAPGKPIAHCNICIQSSEEVTWTSASDDLGIQHYMFRYSKHETGDWSEWINTGKNTPDFSLEIPEGMEGTIYMQVKAVDLAGNYSPLSPIGVLYVNRKPLEIEPLEVTKIIAPSMGQDSPSRSLPVEVKAGGEVIYEIKTTGSAQKVLVRYSDGNTQELYPKYTPTTPRDENMWTGFYYPSDTQTIPLSTPDGTVISIDEITASAPGKMSDIKHSPLLIVNGTIGNGVLPFVPPKVSQ